MVSEGEIWKLEKDLCRCCHAEGNFQNLATPQSFMNEKEIYSDMLRYCYGIDLSPVPGELCTMTYTICANCVVKLRDANTFKKQVQLCEAKFQELYYKKAIKVNMPAPMVVIKDEEEVYYTVDFDSDDDPPECGDDDDDIKKDDDDDDDINSDDAEDFKIVPVEQGNSDVEMIQIEIEELKKKDVVPKRTSNRIKAPPKVPQKKAPPKKKPPPKKKVPVKKEEKETKKKAAEKKEGAGLKQTFHLQPGDYTIEGNMLCCSRCDKKYEKNWSLRYHIRTVHYKVPKYTCDTCKMQFMTLSPFTLHKLQQHNIDDRFHCTACQAIFNTKIQLRKHRNGFHMLGAKYKCPSCDYESFSFEGLYKHKFKHKTVKDYQCRFCKKAFLRKTTLDLHERIHTGDRRKVCHVCSQSFVQKASLNYHMTKYHPEVVF